MIYVTFFGDAIRGGYTRFPSQFERILCFPHQCLELVCEIILLNLRYYFMYFYVHDSGRQTGEKEATQNIWRGELNQERCVDEEGSEQGEKWRDKNLKGERGKEKAGGGRGDGENLGGKKGKKMQARDEER